MILSSSGKLLKKKKTMSLLLGFVHAEIVLIKRQMMAEKCGENGFDYIPHNNINKRLHMNRDSLHLNRKDIYQISCNFKECFNNG